MSDLRRRAAAQALNAGASSLVLMAECLKRGGETGEQMRRELSANAEHLRALSVLARRVGREDIAALIDGAIVTAANMAEATLEDLREALRSIGVDDPVLHDEAPPPLVH